MSRVVPYDVKVLSEKVSEIETQPLYESDVLVTPQGFSYPVCIPSNAFSFLFLHTCQHLCSVGASCSPDKTEQELNP